jgi:hydrogenase maturation factor HypE
MRAFIERVFKSKKLKKEKQAEEQSTETMVDVIIEEVKEVIKKEKHVDCECKECIARIKQNAK